MYNEAVSDRIFSTAIDYDYTFELSSEYLTIDGLAKLEEGTKFTEVAESAKKITLETFALDESASVQARTLLNPLLSCDANPRCTGNLV